MVRTICDSQPSYLIVREELPERIREQGLRRGSALPSIRKISRIYGVSKAAAERAGRSLVRDGISYTQHGRGVFLAVEDPEEAMSGSNTIGVVFGFLEYPRTDHCFYRQVYEGTQEWVARSRCNVLKLFSWRAKSASQKANELAHFTSLLGGLVALGIYSDEDCILLRNTGLPLVVLDHDTDAAGHRLRSAGQLPHHV